MAVYIFDSINIHKWCLYFSLWTNIDSVYTSYYSSIFLDFVFYFSSYAGNEPSYSWIIGKIYTWVDEQILVIYIWIHGGFLFWEAFYFTADDIIDVFLAPIEREPSARIGFSIWRTVLGNLSWFIYFLPVSPVFEFC